MNRDGIQDLVVDGSQTGLQYIFPASVTARSVRRRSSRRGLSSPGRFSSGTSTGTAGSTLSCQANFAVEVLLADASGHFVVPAVYPAGGGSDIDVLGDWTGALTSPGAVDAAVA